MHPTQPTLLYVEASDLIQTWVVPLLQKLGCDVKHARTFDAARKYIESDVAFNIVLLGDITRPAGLVAGVPVDELSIIKSIRDKAQNSHCKIIVFTSVNYLDDAYELGCNDHILKPCGAVELEGKLKPYLKGKKTRGAARSEQPHSL